MLPNAETGVIFPWRTTVSLAVVIAMVPVLLALGDARYTNKADFTVAQAAQAQNSLKLDDIAQSIMYMQVQIAITTASDFQRQLDNHLANPRDTQDWVFERDRLVRQVRRAEQYKQCLIDQRSACDQLRGW